MNAKIRIILSNFGMPNFLIAGLGFDFKLKFMVLTVTMIINCTLFKRSLFTLIPVMLDGKWYAKEGAFVMAMALIPLKINSSTHQIFQQYVAENLKTCFLSKYRFKILWS